MKAEFYPLSDDVSDHGYALSGAAQGIRVDPAGPGYRPAAVPRSWPAARRMGIAIEHSPFIPGCT